MKDLKKSAETEIANMSCQSKGLKESRYNEKTVKRSEWSFEIEKNGNYGDFLTSGDWKSSDGYRSKPRPQIAS